MSDNKPTERLAEISNSVDAGTPNANQQVEVTADDLPLHCPMLGKRLWDSHPKVYIQIEDNGQAQCPYCGTAYTLKESVHSH